MFWYFIVIGLIIISVLLTIFVEEDIFALFLVLFLITLFIFLFCTITINTDASQNANLIALEQKRENLIYQLENKLYLNDNNLGANKLFDEIQTFNAKILGSRAKKDSRWTNWLYSPIWYKIEPIDIKKYS